VEQDTSQKNFPPGRVRSISRALTVALVLTVMFTSAVAVILMYYNASQQAKARLEEKAHEYIVSLARILEMPLWNFDEETLKKIGAAYAQNELIEKLTIADDTGRPYFDFTRESDAPLIKRKVNILHDGHVLGAVEISLTSKYYREANWQLLWSAIGTLCVAILALAVATGFLLRLLLNKPLKRVGEVVNSYASGRYDSGQTDMPFLEFRPLLAVLGEMGRTITSQMTELQNAEQKYRSIFENALEGIFQATPDGRFLSVNPAMARILGYDSPEDLIGHITDIGRQLYVEPGRREEFIRLMRDDRTAAGLEIQLHRKDGSVVWARVHARPVFEETGELGLVEGILTDITERKRAEAERQKLEEQLRQSQKMETVGHLAGGIAHDFNNLLTPVLGYADMLLDGLPDGDHRRAQLQQVKEAAERAKDLTHRLLTFSRKQLIELKTVDLGDIIRRFENMLRRTIRENITIETRVSPILSPVRADAGQIEQVLINLSINAQDAMPEGGLLTIEANDIDLDESYTSRHLEIAPGPYVVFAVSDTGIGMDEQTLQHMFEPFFTTKELGKGTGLGLSTVYGIVKQHGGSICVYSEKNQGSIFKVFLPRVSEEGMIIEEHPPRPGEVVRGVETILVVEDDEMVRELAIAMLRGFGYEVVSAESPDRCIELVHEHTGAIHLLMTDVVMPGMNGKDLFERLRLVLPGLKVLFMSGYTADVIGHHGVLDKGLHFIAKPFSRHALSQKVRQVLDSQ
jgi:two-component system cell cycle sensor histidine kinase/response regulator CckA